MTWLRSFVFLLPLLLLGLPIPSHALTITLTAHTIAQSVDNNTVVTTAIDTTGDSLIVLGTTVFSAGPVQSDSKSNTWTPLTEKVENGNHTHLYYCNPCIVGTNHTFAITAGGGFPVVAVAAFKFTKASSPFDVENGGTTSAATSLATGTVTPSVDNELVVYGIGDLFGATTPVAVDTGSITDQAAFVSGAFGYALAYQVQATATPVNPSWSWTTNARAAAVIATFKVETSIGYVYPGSRARW